MTREDDHDLLSQAFESLKDVPLPSPERRAAGRRAVVARAEQWQIARANRHNGTAPHLAGPSLWKARTLIADSFTVDWRRFRMVAVLVAVLLAIGAAGGVFLAADASGPGDLLYPLDQAAERVRLTLARDDDATARLQIKFANERLREVEQGGSDDLRRQQALEAFDQAIAAVEAVLALDGLTPQSRAAIEAQLVALREARAALASGAPAQSEGGGTITGEREIFGTLDAIDAASATVDGVTYPFAPNAEVKGILRPGDRVKVHLTVLSDGRLLVREIELAGDRRGNDDDDDDRRRGDEVEIFGTLNAISGSSATVDGITYPFAPGAEVKGTLRPGDRVKVHLIALADGTRAVREIELARGDDDDDDRRRGDEVEIFGTLNAISGSSATVDGITYPFAPGAEIKGTLRPGDRVKVHLIALVDGTRAVREIELARGDDDRSGSGRSGSDDRDDDDDDDRSGSGRSGSDDRDDDDDDDD